MKIAFYLSALLVCTLVAISPACADEAKDSDEPTNVLVLGNDNFTTIVNPEPIMLVEFYAPWCGHCKNLAPEYEKAATALLPEMIKLAKVDCDDAANKPTCSAHKVQGFPTLRIFRHGESFDYKGGRTNDTLVSYMIKQSLPALSDVSVNDIDAFSKKDRIVVIAYLPKGRSDEAFQIIDDLSQAMRDDILFGLCEGKAAAAELGVDEARPTIVFYRTFDEPKVTFVGESFTEESLKSFIKNESLPTMGEISPENYNDYVSSGLPLGFFYYDSPEMRNEYGPGIEAVGRKFKKHIKVVYCDAAKFGAHAGSMALTVGTWPAFGIKVTSDSDMINYAFDQSKEPTEKAIEEMVAKLVDGTLEPSFKSQPVPQTQEGPVIDVVGTTFKDIVLDSTKDVLVKFYAPWCGHCQKLAPTWEKLATLFSSQKDKVAIAKMDLTENDLRPGSGGSVDGFPTLRLYSAGENEAKEYSGDRSLEDLLSFISKNAKNPIVIPEDIKEDSAELKDNKKDEDKEEDEDKKEDEEVERDEL